MVGTPPTLTTPPWWSSLCRQHADVATCTGGDRRMRMTTVFSPARCTWRIDTSTLARKSADPPRHGSTATAIGWPRSGCRSAAYRRAFSLPLPKPAARPLRKDERIARCPARSPPPIEGVTPPIEGRSARYRRRDSNPSAEEAGAEAVEVALAGALAAAAQVGQWGLVERLARELGAHRLARGGGS
jgi:hypothetical protein